MLNGLGFIIAVHLPGLHNQPQWDASVSYSHKSWKDRRHTWVAPSEWVTTMQHHLPAGAQGDEDRSAEVGRPRKAMNGHKTCSCTEEEQVSCCIRNERAGPGDKHGSLRVKRSNHHDNIALTVCDQDECWARLSEHFTPATMNIKRVNGNTVKNHQTRESGDTVYNAVTNHVHD